MSPLPPCWPYRPPRPVLNSAVPSLFCGGAPGANQDVNCSFHLPASFASLWCSGPGVAACMYFCIISCSAADICGGALVPASVPASIPASVPASCAFASGAADVAAVSSSTSFDGVMVTSPLGGGG